MCFFLILKQQFNINVQDQIRCRCIKNYLLFVVYESGIKDFDKVLQLVLSYVKYNVDKKRVKLKGRFG